MYALQLLVYLAALIILMFAGTVSTVTGILVFSGVMLVLLTAVTAASSMARMPPVEEQPVPEDQAAYAEHSAYQNRHA